MTLFKDVLAKDGLRGLLRGFPIAFLTIGSFVVSYFLVYEGTKRSLLGWSEAARRYEPAVVLGAGVVGGLCVGVGGGAGVRGLGS